MSELRDKYKEDLLENYKIIVERTYALERRMFNLEERFHALTNALESAKEITLSNMRVVKAINSTTEGELALALRNVNNRLDIWMKYTHEERTKKER